MTSTPITELNDGVNSCLRIAVSFALCVLCSCSDVSQYSESKLDPTILSVRIENISAWIPEREVFALNRDGSGYYEHISAPSDKRTANHKINKRVDFGARKVDFGKVVAQIVELQNYFGDDVSRADIAKFAKQSNLKKAFPCGSRATDNGSYVIYWSNSSRHESKKSDALSNIFVMDLGCRSEEAVAIRSQIDRALNLFDDAVPDTERKK